MTTADGAGSRLSRWLPRALPVVVALWVVACFSPALEAGFLNWDDDANIVDNQHFRGFSAEHLTWMFTRPHGGPYMPLTWLSLACDHALFGLGPGFSPPEAGAFHATSIGLHALAALLFCGLARRLFAAAGADPHARTTVLAAALAAALFAAHPLRVESVAWVTERRDVLSGVFFVLSVSAYLRATPGRGAPRLVPGPAGQALVASAGAVALFFTSVELGPERLSFQGPGPVGLLGALAALGLATAAAPHAAAGTSREVDGARLRAYAFSVAWLLLCFLSKGLGVALPLVLLCLDVWPLGRWRRGDGLRPALALVAEKTPQLALALTFGLLAIWGQGRYPEALASLAEHPPAQRLAQAVYGLWFYPTRTLLPVNLVPLVELPLAGWIATPRFLIAAAGVLALAVGVFLLRRRIPALAVACVSFVLLIAPVLGVSQAGAQLVADRYSYLACMPFALLLAGGWLQRLRGPAQSRWRFARWPALAVVLVLGALTHRQSTIWHDTETLWNHTLAVFPDAVRPHYMLGQLYYRSAQEASDTEGGQRDLAGLERAREEFRLGIERDPRLAPYYYSIYGALLLDLGDLGESARILEMVVRVRPDDAVNLTNLGVALRLQERPREALEYAQRAVQADPDYTKGWWQLGLTREALGDRPGAAQAYREVLEDWPRYAAAKRKLEALEP